MFRWLYENSIFYDAIKGHRENRKYEEGVARAQEEYADLLACKEEERADLLEQQRSLRKIFTLDSPFIRGWMHGWIRKGENDAEKCFCHAKKFHNHHYNQGWFHTVKAMMMRGWQNDKITKIYAQMKKEYFDKPSAKSNSGF